MSPGRLTHRTISGVLWMAWGKGGRALLNFGALALLARLLTPREFGTAGAALLIIEFSSIFSRLGLGPAIVQRKELEPRHLRAAFSGSLAIGVLFGVAVWHLAPAAGRFFRDPEVEPILRSLAWIFPLSGLSAMAEALMLRELHFRWIANVDLVTFGVGEVLVSVTLAWLGFGAWALAGGALTTTLAKCAFYLTARRPPLTLRMEWGAFTEMLYFGGGFTIARVANQLALQGDNLVVGHWMGPAALGLYGRAYSLMATPASVLGKVLDDVLFPTLAKVQDDVERLRKAYRRGVAFIALLSLPTSVAMVVLAPEIVRVALGPRWGAAVLPFQVLAAGMLFRTSYKMSDSLARSAGVVYRRAQRQVVYAGLVIGGAFFGLRWGIPGVAIGVLGALVANFLLMAHLSLDVCRMTWGTLLAAHRPAILLAIASGTLSLTVSMVLRSWALPPVVVLLVAGSTSMAGLAWLALRHPDVFLGTDGRWIMGALAAFVAEKRGRPGPAVAQEA